VTGRELERQAGALGEADQRNPMRRNAPSNHVLHNSGHTTERGTEVRLVLLQRSKKRVRVPRVTSGLRRNVGDVRDLELVREREDGFGRRAAAVHEHDDESGIGWIEATPDDRLFCVGIIRHA
jgi:hypothetical protein